MKHEFNHPSGEELLLCGVSSWALWRNALNLVLAFDTGGESLLFTSSVKTVAKRMNLLHLILAFFDAGEASLLFTPLLLSCLFFLFLAWRKWLGFCFLLLPSMNVIWHDWRTMKRCEREKRAMWGGGENLLRNNIVFPKKEENVKSCVPHMHTFRAPANACHVHIKFSVMNTWIHLEPTVIVFSFPSVDCWMTG